MILRAAPDALGAAGPAEHDADAPSLNETEEKPSAPASQKHSGDPEATEETPASKKHANDMSEEKKKPATEKPTIGAKTEKSPPTSPKLTPAASKKKKTSASKKPTRKTAKTNASPKPAPKKPAVKKPAAKQPSKKDARKEDRRTSRLPPKRTDVLLPGPYEGIASDSSDTDTPNPALATGDDSLVGDASQAPRAQASPAGPATSATSATTPPPKRSPSPDPSLRVDYEESEPDMDREAGEVEESGSSPPLTDEQRVFHPGSPISPKTVAAIPRARALEEALSRRDDPPPATPESQVITNADVDEGVPPELLRPENRQHLSDRSRQTAWQPIGAKRECETPAPRTREQLLALRYWTREEYRAHLRQSRMPGPGGPQCDKCPVVFLSDSRLARQLSETAFEGWLHHLGYPEPEFLNCPFRIDWLAQRRLRFRMTKMIADDTWTGRFLERHKPMPGCILEEVLQKIQKSWQSQPIAPRSVLGPVSADQVRGRSQKRPRGRCSPLRGEPQAPTSFDYSGSHATSPGTGTDRYAPGASIASRHGNRGSPRYQTEPVEPATSVVSDQDAQRRPTGPRPHLESLLAGLEACQRLLDGQRTEMVALRARVQEVETHIERLQDVSRDSDRLRDHVWGLPGQICRLGDEVDRLRDRCSQSEGNDGAVRQDLGRHLAWIRSLYDRVGRLKTQEARRVAAQAAAPTPSLAPVPSEPFVRVMADLPTVLGDAVDPSVSAAPAGR
ncbi:unnamed protein product [Phytophthora fragariaefolia]|uniref:Unnamed protein product n=1 Tax=Phytophthora fragariaefolia TaxID=1490495 RepID=A0A9W7D2Q8_9STRA|nr:unnamed protein product [Phytophthora fragariaefolia]